MASIDPNEIKDLIDAIHGTAPAQLAGDVVPFPQDKLYKSPSEMLPLNFNRAFGPGYDFDWHKILTPAPANDALLQFMFQQGAPAYG